MIEIFFIGAAIGLICVGGLGLGVKWLFKSRDESLDEGTRFKYGLWGAFVLVGQFVAAGLILFFVKGLNKQPLALASGLLSVNLLLPFVMGKLFFGNKKSAEQARPESDKD